MSSDSSNSSTEFCDLGNTKPSRAKQISPAVRWCFTFNNYTDIELSSMISQIRKDCKKAIVSKEIGKSGTPHLQGYLEFHRKIRPKGSYINRIHWEKAMGNASQNFDYCTKDGDIVVNFGFPKPVKLISPDFQWEQEILDIIKDEPCDRKIYWYWGEGNVGKTSFCKYLIVKHKAIMVGGKGADMRNAIVDYVKTNGYTPELILINIPKSHGTEYLSYEGMENVKDMCFYSGKYEGGMVCGNPPHLFIFANEPPDCNKLSNDRWVITEIFK